MKTAKYITMWVAAAMLITITTDAGWWCGKKKKSQLECVSEKEYSHDDSDTDEIENPKSGDCFMLRRDGLLDWSPCAENPECSPDYGNCGSRNC